MQSITTAEARFSILNRQYSNLNRMGNTQNQTDKTHNGNCTTELAIIEGYLIQATLDSDIEHDILPVEAEGYRSVDIHTAWSESLLNAVQSDNREHVDILLKQRNGEPYQDDHSIETSNHHIIRALNVAINLTHLSCIQILLSSVDGHFVNISDQHQLGSTILLRAAQNSNSNCLKLLLTHASIDVNKADETGCTALFYAVKRNLVDNLRLLLDHPGLELDRRDTFEGLTALSAAAQYGFVGCVDALLRAGSDVTLSSYEGRTALIYAARGGHVDCVSLLLQVKTVDVNKRGAYGFTALMFAASLGHADCVLVLLEAGANTCLGDLRGQTALMCAAGQGHADCVRNILMHSKGPEVDKRDTDGITALMFASRRGSVECVQALLCGGADVTVTDSRGKSAMDKSSDRVVKEMLSGSLILTAAYVLK